MDHQKILELTGPVQTFRTVKNGPPWIVEWGVGSYGLGFRIEINGPVLRVEDGEEKIFISFRYSDGDEVEGERFILFSELTVEDQHLVRMMFPDCHLLMTVH